MIKHSVIWDKRAFLDLRAISLKDAERIVKKVESHLAIDPINLGKVLSGKLRGLHCYRVGDYRVIYELQKQKLVIIVVKVGHRREVYKAH